MTLRYVALGGGSEVGASCNFIDLDGRRFLIDAGIRLGVGEAGGPPDPLPYLDALNELGAPEAVLVTHAHLDHIGALPLVHRAFPGVPIYATVPTVHLMRVLLYDAIKIMSLRAEQEYECPLYGAELVESMFRKVIPVPLGGSIGLGGGVRAHFFSAGHVLGAAMVGLEGEGGRVLCTGDVSVGAQRTIPGLHVPRFRPHLLIMESTYGNRLHADRHREEKNLADTVAEVVERGGHALIPAFALGRAQEVILLLHAYQQAGRIGRFPVWIDGMVRSICSTYTGFPEYLQGPVKRYILKGGNPFYREKAGFQAVTSAAQRERVLAGPPACIVSSSGMLTGGPSQFYAARLAGDPKNAILLCGYQDEESPGRRLLELAEGETNELVLDGQTVSVQCRVEKYGLSAHADAGELAALCGRLQPRRVVLVHGDSGARMSLAEALAGSYPVWTPENGEELVFSIRRRPAGDRKPEGKVETKPAAEFSPAAAWEALVQDRSTLRRFYSVEELASLWYGDALTPERQELVGRLLEEDRIYFTADWRHPSFYQPRRPDQVAVDRRRLEIMREYRDLPGHLVLLRDDSGSVRAGICYDVDETGFYTWRVGRGYDRQPAENLLEVIGPWMEKQAGGVSGWQMPAVGKKRLNRFLREEVEPLYRQLRPEQIREVVESAGGGPFTLRELAELMEFDPGSHVYLAALGWRLNSHPEYFSRTGRTDGPPLYALRPDAPDGDIPLEERDIVDRMEQNAALKVIDEHFPPSSGLYRRGLSRERGEITLYFYFPGPAGEKYRDLLEELEAVTGWSVKLHGEAHHGALIEAVRSILPAGWELVKNPSIRREQNCVEIKCTLPTGVTEEEKEGVARRYREKTGYDLIVVGSSGAVAGGNFSSGKGVSAGAPVPPGGAAGRMEANRAYAVIRDCLKAAGAEVYRVGRKSGRDGEYIEVGFISPEVGRRYESLLEDLSRETGWPLRVNPRPNQHEIKNLVRAGLRQEWGLKREPGFFEAEKTVVVRLASPPGEHDPEWEQLVREVKEKTGYDLKFRT